MIIKHTKKDTYFSLEYVKALLLVFKQEGRA